MDQSSITHLLPLSLVQTKSNMLACMNPTPWCFVATHYDLFSAKQHNRHLVVLGDELNPHPAMVEVILQPEMGVEKRVLDIGQSPSVTPQQTLSRFPSFRR